MQRTAPHAQSMKEGADWLAWALQFIVGFFVGAVLAVYITRRSRYVPWEAPSEHILMLVLGGALIGAGLASYMGDRLWFGGSYRVIPPDDVRHSATSKALSILAGTTGGALVLLALLLNFHVF